MVKYIHEKIGRYNEIERQIIYNCLYLYQLSLILEEESIDLAFALLIICIKSIANTEFFFAWKEVLDWKDYGKSNEWDEFSKKKQSRG